MKLFIENGYKETKMSDIIEEANVSNSSFQNLFRTKDGVLMDLVEFMFCNQFSIANAIVPENAKPSYIYAAETAIQITLTELNENLREIYVEAYTHPKTAEYIFQRTSSELYTLFSKNLPECSESDFYELEIGTSGIMRSYMAKPCVNVGAASSKREAREFVQSGAVSINGEKVTDSAITISNGMFIDDTYIIIKRGKKNYYIGKKL